MNNKNEILNDLIKAIHNYYPIEQAILNEEFEGYKVLQKLIDTKIHGLTNGQLPKECYALVKEIESFFVNCPINVHFYTNFPSYSIGIELANDTSDYTRRTSWLNVSISLLTNYFTVFFEERNLFNGFKEQNNKNMPILFRILSSKNHNIDTENIFVEKIKDIVATLFTEYKYINHRLLFNYKLPNGIPIGFFDPIPNFYPIYAFLFDNWMDLPTTVIIE